MEENNEIHVVDTMEETDEKCPQCGGVMDFDPASGRLKCPYCGYDKEIESGEHTDQPEKAAEMDFYAAEHTANKDWGVETKAVICEACGAESIYDVMQTSAICPFCGSNQVMDAAEQDTIAPGGVVPFAVSDKQASERFKKWIKRKWLCPNLAKESASPKKFRGIYLPYWTFDTDTYSSYTGEYGIEHTHTDSKGHTHTSVSWHRTSGAYKEFFNDELVLASKNHSINMLKGLEPFDTENNKVYKPEYIAGFVAERYSIGLKEGWDTAVQSIKGKIKKGVKRKIVQEHHADQTRNIYIDTDFRNITYKYLLLPIWISSYKYKDTVYQFMVNGQTGKVSGKTPLSIPKTIIMVVGLLALLGILSYFFGFFTE